MSLSSGPSSLRASSTRALQRYYRFHSPIYDATRWSFLFGRQRIIRLAASHIDHLAPASILEVGCGTGTNLLTLAKTFPNATITGVDISQDMLLIAKRKLGALNKRVTLLNQPYNVPLQFTTPYQPFDLVLFSYALSMFNPGWEQALQAARGDLSDNGIIAVVDFHSSRYAGFQQWMQVNHVRMERHLAPALHTHFLAMEDHQINAYGGIWQYLLFIGRNRL